MGCCPTKHYSAARVTAGSLHFFRHISPLSVFTATLSDCYRRASSFVHIHRLPTSRMFWTEGLHQERALVQIRHGGTTTLAFHGGPLGLPKRSSDPLLGRAQFSPINFP